MDLDKGGGTSWPSKDDRPGRTLRIVGVDQRGVLRSGDLPPREPLTIDALIAHVEALRRHLRIPDGVVLGRSVGGGYALRYATHNPGSVRGVVFDCPCWVVDHDAGEGADALYHRCHEAAQSPAPVTITTVREPAPRVLIARAPPLLARTASAVSNGASSRRGLRSANALSNATVV